MIVVTTPTGHIGHHVVEKLLAAGKPVRAIVRNAARLAPEVRDRIEVIEGSHGDAAVVDRALDGASALFWVAPPDQSKTLDEVYIEFTRPAAEAIRKHGVRRVVSVTALGRDTPWQQKAGLVTASIHMDDLLVQSGAAFRGLAMPSFMDNTLQQVESIKSQGMMFGPLDPDKKAPTTATRDIGEVAARLLGDNGWSGSEDVPVLGPEDLSMNEIAAIVSDVLGRDVRYQQVPFGAFEERLASFGMSESFRRGFVEMMRAKNEGMDTAGDRTGEMRTPTSFRQWCEEELKPAVLA